MFQAFGTASFHSPWYWVLVAVIWTGVCQRPLGVPFDMVLRARQRPETAARVDMLAAIASERIAATARKHGATLSGAAGFGLALLAGFGFLGGDEAAQAGFLLLGPLALATLATVRLALTVEREGLRGPALQRQLRLCKLWNQVIAVAAILCMALAALGHPPRAFGF